jgi:hypothetical protein
MATKKKRTVFGNEKASRSWHDRQNCLFLQTSRMERASDAVHTNAMGGRAGRGESNVTILDGILSSCFCAPGRASLTWAGKPVFVYLISLNRPSFNRAILNLILNHFHLLGRVSHAQKPGGFVKSRQISGSLCM